MTANPWTPRRIDHLRELWASRMSLAAICHQLDVGETGLRRKAAELGLPSPADRRKPVVPDDRVLLAVRDGASDREIARQLGVNSDVVYRIRRRNGLVAPQKPPATPEVDQGRALARAEACWPELLRGREFSDRPGLGPRVFRAMRRPSPAFSVGCAAAMCVDRG